MAEMGCDPELRLSLGSGYRICLVSSLKAGSGCFVSLVESFLSGCVAFRVEQQRRKTQQKKMTMFYQGRVCVCDATEIQVCCFSRFVFYSRGREALALLPKGDFILTGEEVARTFGLTPVVTSGMAESYDGSVGAVVWGEDMVRHVALMMRGGGVGWRSVRTPLPRMLTSPSTWSSERTPRRSGGGVREKGEEEEERRKPLGTMRSDEESEEEDSDAPTRRRTATATATITIAGRGSGLPHVHPSPRPVLPLLSSLLTLFNKLLGILYVGKSLFANRDKECPFCILERQIARSLSLDGPLEAPSKIHKSLALFAEHFRWGRQEDAHEFLRYVIDACHNACLKIHKRNGGGGTPDGNPKAEGRSGPSTVMKEIFGGALLSQVKCLACKGESNKSDEIMDICLDLFQSSSLKDALARFFHPEVLDGNNKYNCGKLPLCGPPAIGRYREKSTVSDRLREKKGRRRRGKEEKKILPPRHPCPRGDGTSPRSGRKIEATVYGVCTDSMILFVLCHTYVSTFIALSNALVLKCTAKIKCKVRSHSIKVRGNTLYVGSLMTNRV
ncbi:hypothetical protein GW17_00014661 [Ensete ventricosum]|nr:hypothetical protein GW17_00014661 [Ensete ventricosum]